MKRPFKLQILWFLVSLSFDRFAFEHYPKLFKKILWRKFQKRVLSKSPQYAALANQPIEAFPIQGKNEFMRDFNTINTRGIQLKEALDIAVSSEESRDFSSSLDDITVGLSSGTSGNRGVFLVSERERAMWVAMVLQRILGISLRKRKVAFFLRANSKLYSSVTSKLISFEFYDLLRPVEEHLPVIQVAQPDIIVGQPSLLMMLTEAQLRGQIQLKPSKIISVAEVLSPEDEEAINVCFGLSVDQVYQCTEGLFGQTCKHGKIHLNEDGLIIEKEWLDRTRFVPIVTDMRRDIQPVLRYKMNDILHASECTCGSRMQAISQIEGRTDDVLQFNENKRIFPDFIRRAIMGAHPDIDNYQVVQTSAMGLSLFITPKMHGHLASTALHEILNAHGISDVTIEQIESKRHENGTKFRRVHAERN
jgi:putative adenylate-forming enzyme